MLFRNSLKGAFLGVLFLFQLIGHAQVVDDLSNSPVWHLLLQHNDKGFLIQDHDFYIAGPETDLKSELQRSIDLFFNTSSLTANQIATICRFPARYEWLRQQLDYHNWQGAQSLCPDFAEFIQRVPFDRLYLVYAAENITQPSSMMGHSFLALKGKTNDGTELAHALTFFTDVDLTRPVDLIWGSLVKGKPGYLMVSPHRQQMAFYLHQEQRNVYEYPVNMKADQLALLQAHIWELRQVSVDYFFHSLNCATLTNNLLGFASADLLPNSVNWLSPLDVVKVSYNAGILSSPTLYPSDKWKVRETRKVITSRGLLPEFYHFYETGQFSEYLEPGDRVLFTELGHGLSTYQYHQSKLTESELTAKKRAFAVASSNEAQHQIELPASRDPLLRADDSQFGISWSQDERIMLRWLPAAHLLSDNHRHAFSESELQLFSITASYKPWTRSARIDDATLYAVSSFIPYDSLTGGVSGRFHIRASRLLGFESSQVLTPSIGGGIGATVSLHHDVMLYALFNASAEQHHGLYLTAGPEVGLFMYQVFNNKSLVSFRHDLNYLGSGKSSQRLKWQQSWFASRQYTWHWHLEKQWLNKQRDLSAGFEFRIYY